MQDFGFRAPAPVLFQIMLSHKVYVEVSEVSAYLGGHG